MKLDNLENMTAAECADLLKEVTARDAEVHKRLEAIKPGGKLGGEPGTERRKVLMSGNVDSIRALDNEHADLLAESEVLKTQASGLQARRQSALAQEAVKGMPNRYKALGGALSVAEATMGDLAKALALVEHEYRELYQARFTANAAGLGAKVPPGNPELVGRIAALVPVARTIAPKSRVFSGRHDDVAEDLGIEIERNPLLRRSA